MKVFSKLRASGNVFQQGQGQDSERTLGSPCQRVGAAKPIRSGCKLSERMRLEVETKEDIMMSE